MREHSTIKKHPK
ncbi:hypothetical protein BpHYR1_022947 [Brachionus plicatilis]|uniref:Uncharacterized protein n=1 Tax=Brachionus plicatilis TaxID=10195 RepID=A0A3M7R9Z9_BRAPC|nr:hypothetical protein BpHYR1_022947 [Brachionus plicatilis]